MNLLLDSAVKATLILFAAWIAALALRRASADVRHRIWLVAMIAVALLPAALSIPQTAIPTAARIVVPALAASPQMAHKLPWLPNMLFLIWAAGASVVLLRLIVGLVAAARITRLANDIGGVLYSDRAATPRPGAPPRSARLRRTRIPGPAAWREPYRREARARTDARASAARKVGDR